MNWRPPNDRCLLYEQVLLASRQLAQDGRCSSHFRCRRRHSQQPPLDPIGFAGRDLFVLDALMLS